MPKWEPAVDRGLWALSDPRLSNPSQDEKDVLLWSEELGAICSSPSPSPTHLSHTTNINHFQNKVWEIYFYKEVCSFVHWSSSFCLIMFLLIFIFVYVCGYTTVIQAKGGTTHYQVTVSNLLAFQFIMLKRDRMKRFINNFGHPY